MQSVGLCPHALTTQAPHPLQLHQLNSNAAAAACLAQRSDGWHRHRAPSRKRPLRPRWPWRPRSWSTALAFLTGVAPRPVIQVPAASAAVCVCRLLYDEPPPRCISVCAPRTPQDGQHLQRALCGPTVSGQRLQLEVRLDAVDAKAAAAAGSCSAVPAAVCGTTGYVSVLRVACRYKEGTLSVGENSCIDRCASKYWQVRRCGHGVCAQGHARTHGHARFGPP